MNYKQYHQYLEELCDFLEGTEESPKPLSLPFDIKHFKEHVEALTDCITLLEYIDGLQGGNQHNIIRAVQNRIEKRKL